MLWPGSEAPNHGRRPDHWHPYNISISAATRVDTVLKWLSLPPDKRPNFTALYLDKVDYNGHLYGPDSPQVDDAIYQADTAVGMLVDGLKRLGIFNQVDLVIVSDHGMARVQHVVYLDEFFDTAHAHALMMGGIIGINADEGESLDTRKLLAHHPHMQCWRKKDIPARFHYGTNARVPQVICLAQEGWLLTTHAAEAARVRPEQGVHGYDNAAPPMRAIFIGYGPSFRKGYVAPPFPNVDVYPLLAHLLGIAPENNDGNFAAVKPMLRTH